MNHLVFRLSMFFFSSLITSLSLAAELPDFPFVSATGQAEREVVPDIATVQLRIMSFDKSSDAALKTVNLATTAVTDTLLKYKVELNNIEASDIDKSAIRKRDPEFNNLQILGYEVSRSMTIKLDKLAHYSDLMSDIIVINHVSGINASFDVSNREQLEAELIQEASQNAKARAEHMAKGLDVKIHSVFAIAQNSDFAFGNTGFGPRNEKFMAMREFGGGEYRTAVFAPKSINVSQNINVIFKIK